MNRTAVVSSNIKSVGYEQGRLEVEFLGGTVYEYADVPADIVKTLMASESIGKALRTLVVQGGFSVRRLDVPPELVAIAEADPIRVMQHRICRDCRHEWDQPSATGACPRCHGERVHNGERRVSVEARK